MRCDLLFPGGDRRAFAVRALAVAEDRFLFRAVPRGTGSATVLGRSLSLGRQSRSARGGDRRSRRKANSRSEHDGRCSVMTMESAVVTYWHRSGAAQVTPSSSALPGCGLCVHGRRRTDLTGVDGRCWSGEWTVHRVRSLERCFLSKFSTPAGGRLKAGVFSVSYVGRAVAPSLRRSSLSIAKSAG
jgi:hypothetical protein